MRRIVKGSFGYGRRRKELLGKVKRNCTILQPIQAREKIFSSLGGIRVAMGRLNCNQL